MQDDRELNKHYVLLLQPFAHLRVGGRFFFQKRGLPKGTLETHLRIEKVQSYLCSYLTGSLALMRNSLRGAPIRIRKKFRVSRYLSKNTRVIDESLHISTLIFSFRIYIVCITSLR